MKKTKEKKIINQELHQALILAFVGLVMIFLLIKTVFL